MKNNRKRRSLKFISSCFLVDQLLFPTFLIKSFPYKQSGWLYVQALRIYQSYLLPIALCRKLISLKNAIRTYIMKILYFHFFFMISTYCHILSLKFVCFSFTPPIAWSRISDELCQLWVIILLDWLSICFLSNIFIKYEPGAWGIVKWWQVPAFLW